MIVCGTQTDLRSNVELRVELRDYGESPVSEQEGREYAQVGVFQLSRTMKRRFYCAHSMIVLCA